MSRRSVATIDRPEFINVKPYNPLISECEIKVMYVGENRNRSYISKEVAAEMANSLPGCPIVGYYKEEKQDFMDHGDQVIIDGDGVKFKCLTRPYGFVAPNAKVWFQKFEDTDEFGNAVVREYLMTTGFLWTGQYEEAKQILDDGGKPHSMEIDKDTLNGHWSKNSKTQIEFFIIHDGIFSKLCVLGDDVEPCFEGSSVTAPDISTSFTKVDKDFTQTLFTMMQELKNALEGGQDMAFSDVKENFSVESDKINENATAENQNVIEDTASTSFAKDEEKEKEDESKEDTKADDKKADDSEEDKEDKKDKFVKDEEKDDDKEDKASEEDKDEDKKDDKEDKDDDKEKYALLQSEYENLQSQFSALESECQELRAFKAAVEDERKTDLINSFYMLSDEDKADVITNKSQYSLDEIESKLSVICVRKKVNFTVDEEQAAQPVEQDVITTFNLGDVDSNIPSWIKAVRQTAQELG